MLRQNLSDWIRPTTKYISSPVRRNHKKAVESREEFYVLQTSSVTCVTNSRGSPIVFDKLSSVFPPVQHSSEYGITTSAVFQRIRYSNESDTPTSTIFQRVRYPNEYGIPFVPHHNSEDLKTDRHVFFFFV